LPQFAKTDKAKNA